MHVAGGTADAFGIVPEHDGGEPQAVPFATGVWQTPATQVSSVQPFPSLPQAVPVATFECAHPDAGTHESLVQTFESLQSRAGPGWQTPLRH